MCTNKLFLSLLALLCLAKPCWMNGMAIDPVYKIYRLFSGIVAVPRFLAQRAESAAEVLLRASIIDDAWASGKRALPSVVRKFLNMPRSHYYKNEDDHIDAPDVKRIGQRRFNRDVIPLLEDHALTKVVAELITLYMHEPEQETFVSLKADGVSLPWWPKGEFLLRVDGLEKPKGLRPGGTPNTSFAVFKRRVAVHSRQEEHDFDLYSIQGPDAQWVRPDPVLCRGWEDIKPCRYLCYSKGRAPVFQAEKSAAKREQEVKIREESKQQWDDLKKKHPSFVAAFNFPMGRSLLLERLDPRFHEFLDPLPELPQRRNLSEQELEDCDIDELYEDLD